MPWLPFKSRADSHEQGPLAQKCTSVGPHMVPSWKLVPTQESVAVAKNWLSYPSEHLQGLTDVIGSYTDWLLCHSGYGKFPELPSS